jgi:hypothetical protein
MRVDQSHRRLASPRSASVESRLPKSLSDPSHQIEDFYRFLKEVVAAALKASTFHMGEHADRQYRNAAGPDIASNKAHNLTAVDIRQAGFEQHNVGWMLFQYLDGTLAGGGDLGLKTGECKLLLQRHCLSRLVIDDENGLSAINSHVRYYYPDWEISPIRRRTSKTARP